MTGNDNNSDAAGFLRRRAEEAARNKAARFPESSGNLTTEEIHATLHELRVHQIELEMQNEELRRAHAELETVRKRYFDLYDLAPVGYCTVDDNGLIIEANLTVAAMLGTARGALVQSPFNRYILNDDQDIYYLHRKKILEDSEPQAFEIRMVKNDGSPIWVLLSASTVSDGDDRTVNRIAVSDIGERKRSEAALEQARKIESLGVFAGGIAHDFNNLLAGMFGFIEAAKRSSSEVNVSKHLDKALDLFGRAKGLSQQLLTFSKGGVPNKKIIALEPVIRKYVLFALSGSPVEAVFAIDSALACGEYDENQISQVINNIVINAVQAMPSGGMLFVTAGNAVVAEDEHPPLAAGTYVHIAIRDTGTGMSPEVQKKIFDPFYTTKETGSGLGLAVCYSIVQKHGGIIEVLSAPGAGSTFHLYLPATVRHAEPAAADDNFNCTGNERILIMDDEEFLRQSISEGLSFYGYDVAAVKNGGEAIAEIHKAFDEGRPFRAAFFDLTVRGGMGGKDAVVEIRKRFPDMPVFVVSGYSDDPAVAHYARYGFSGCLAKPFKTIDIIRLFRKHVPRI